MKLIFKSLFPIFLLLLWSASAKGAVDTLNPCLKGQALHVVVLGSSTAAGSGPSHPDSTWVNRFRKYLQAIDVNNQVTNLAQGGTTTYQIMPDWFVAPAGRPTTNPARNVTQAISLNADAIIVNMPSNDAANGFSLNEHMFNFHSIVASADSAGIPVWVCTTQPRSFSATKVQLQRDVRDSIFSAFGIKAIDFWSGFANSQGTIDSLYDSGDGVHMNDRAHRVLFNRVAGKNILSSLIDTFSVPEHSVVGISANLFGCGATYDSLKLSLTNLGITANYQLVVDWTITNLAGGTSLNLYDTLRTAIKTCELSYSRVAINTSLGGKWLVSAHLQTQNDSILINDYSDTLLIKTTGQPLVQAQNDTVCKGGLAVLRASGGDTLLWYDSANVVVGFGDSLLVSLNSSSASYRASAVNGPLFFQEQLVSSTSSNINFNGVMFNLIAKDSLSVDSIQIVLQTVQPTEVTSFSRQGSYQGFEGDVNAWSIWGTDSLFPSGPNDISAANFGSQELAPGDTLGVYLHLQQSANLRYQSLPNEVIFEDSLLAIQAGTGVAHTFGASYYPRAWQGSVYYHHGFNPRGNCAVDTTVSAYVSSDDIALGADTILGLSDSILLAVPNHFRKPLWSTGDTSYQIWVDSSMANTMLGMIRLKQVSVQAENRQGCFVEDSILISFKEESVGILSVGVPQLEVYPNPFSNRLSIQNPYPNDTEVRVYSSYGFLIYRLNLPPMSHDFTLELPAGTYLLMSPNNLFVPMKVICTGP